MDRPLRVKTWEEAGDAAGAQTKQNDHGGKQDTLDDEDDEGGHHRSVGAVVKILHVSSVYVNIVRPGSKISKDKDGTPDDHDSVHNCHDDGRNEQDLQSTPRCTAIVAVIQNIGPVDFSCDVEDVKPLRGLFQQ